MNLNEFIEFNFHMTLIYFTEHVTKSYFPVPVGPVAYQDEEGQAATKASKLNLEDHQISLTRLLTNKTEDKFG